MCIRDRSYADARDQVRREMVISRVRQRRVAERIQVTDQEVQNFLASDLGKMQLSEEFRLANILIPVSEGASSNEIQAADRQAQDVYKRQHHTTPLFLSQADDPRLGR